MVGSYPYYSRCRMSSYEMRLTGVLPSDIRRAKERGWAHKLDPCNRLERFKVHKAVLDSTAGYVLAYKSCAWARYLAAKSGVKFILDPVQGKVVGVGNKDDGAPTVTTADGSVHSADLVVVAGRRSLFARRHSDSPLTWSSQVAAGHRRCFLRPRVSWRLPPVLWQRYRFQRTGETFGAGLPQRTSRS